MAIRLIRDLPSYADLSLEYPLSSDTAESIAKHRREITDILSGVDKRKLIILGPCSAWNYHAVIQYAYKVSQVQASLADRYKLVMRVYTQKSRTFKGWHGPLIQPDPKQECDIAKGLRYCRSLMLEVASFGLAIADELLYTNVNPALTELLSWGAIGARSSEDQEHRVFASSLDFAVGIKNPTNGSLAVGLNGVATAQMQHHAILHGKEVITSGNGCAHLVLRGGNAMPNYSENHLNDILVMLPRYTISNPSVIVDASHDNSIVNGVKSYLNQVDVVRYLMQQCKDNQSIDKLVKGVMLESFLVEGRQDILIGSNYIDGLSITDACLNWQQTLDLLFSI